MKLRPICRHLRRLRHPQTRLALFMTGAYSIQGATLKLHIAELSKDVDIVIDGPKLVVNGQENWIQPNR